jgi:hypothetical protein
MRLADQQLLLEKQDNVIAEQEKDIFYQFRMLRTHDDELKSQKKKFTSLEDQNRLLREQTNLRLDHLYANLSSELINGLDDVNTSVHSLNGQQVKTLEDQKRSLTEQTSQRLGELYLNVSTELNSRVDDVNTRINTLNQQQ